MLQSQPIAAPIVMVCHEIQNAVEEERNAYERGPCKISSLMSSTTFSTKLSCWGAVGD